ncbi:hypothetical protein HPB50_004908 [Hyalomma asiaticum]|uniref:Uncharacterized protein n=1 Tax=Hyalomma asiaticum TaxID=266040 RepID=A0ACB7RJ12_HYAAI|nr:hypothetical protein HPB50_004908 [Hyalomma asiaticum]
MQDKRGSRRRSPGQTSSNLSASETARKQAPNKPGKRPTPADQLAGQQVAPPDRTRSKQAAASSTSLSSLYPSALLLEEAILPVDQLIGRWGSERAAIRRIRTT